MKSRCGFVWSWLAVLSIYYKSCLIKLLSFPPYAQRSETPNFPGDPLEYINVDTVLCPGANMALQRGWKGEAEEAIRIKGRFCQYTCRSAPRKHRGRPRQLHALCGKKAGEESHYDSAMHGPRGKQLPWGNNYCTTRALAEVRNNLLFIRSMMCVPQSRPR